MPADDYTTEHWPTEIRLRKQEKILEIDFDDGSRFALPDRKSVV